ncbi:CPBP family intramembrane metalloprotease [Enterobacter bugandensis]|uniref:CPBP family intramembrane glutamic endopeptidase n=1 Tax=Enterobacter TaxID=547 RepID=UPI001886D003|nr:MULTISPECIES: CPBP family intramembrane glutamic endopeptidase [Enterobacter]MBF2792963.1 CPBP family intramembrane metalloprotease [Enterobacter asburiae]MDO2434509.1 CPBP family intramembrane metalloprotease [Enterobacter bugandensis]MDO2447528.1 CPBP family intramembrane metalloprotease [Enterobacter bugandensis]HBH9258395.1 CPBP family intramembrane metalloprotease [Escherichia coli]
MELKKRKDLYLVPVIISIAITALPLLTTKWVGLEKSLYFMYIAEFALGLWIFIYIYKSHLRIGGLTTLLTCLLLILFIQLIIYVKKEPDFEALHIPSYYITPYLFAIFVVPFYEECIYRGCLMDFFCNIFKGGLILPIVLSSAIFCGMHTQYTGLLNFAVLFIVSIILSFSRIKSGSLLSPMLLHSSMNAFVILLSNLNVF